MYTILTGNSTGAVGTIFTTPSAEVVGIRNITLTNVGTSNTSVTSIALTKEDGIVNTFYCYTGVDSGNSVTYKFDIPFRLSKTSAITLTNSDVSAVSYMVELVYMGD